MEARLIMEPPPERFISGTAYHGDQVGALEVHIHDAVPELFVRGTRPEGVSDADSCAVHQYVEPAVGLHCGTHHPLGVLRDRDVAHDLTRLAALSSYRRNNLASGLLF